MLCALCVFVFVRGCVQVRLPGRLAVYNALARNCVLYSAKMHSPLSPRAYAGLPACLIFFFFHRLVLVFFVLQLHICFPVGRLAGPHRKCWTRVLRAGGTPASFHSGLCKCLAAQLPLLPRLFLHFTRFFSSSASSEQYVPTGGL